MRTRLACVIAACLGLLACAVGPAAANPRNGKVVLQAFWWDCEHEDYD